MKGKFNELINSQTPVLVDFSAEWCGPCQTMAPVLERLKQQIGDKARVIKIDIDRNPAVARAFKVQSVPTLIVFRDGQIKWRQAGVVTARQLEEVLKNYF